MIEVDAIDIFIESDSSDDGEEGPALISVRVPYDREFARQIREIGAKWDDQSKEWRLYGTEELVKQVASLCKAAFPRLPRRRNRLVAAQLSTEQGRSWVSEDKEQTRQVELIARVQFVVNRTVRNYRLGQNLKWAKEFKQTIELPASEKADSTAPQTRFTREVEASLPELERLATSAFEALLVGKKEAVAAILREAGIEQN